MKTVMIIDDDKRIRDFVRLFLEREGYTVLEASDGKEGMSLFSRQQPDLVILDIFMPEQDGLETIGEIRDRYGNCKIIAISGGGSISGMDILKYSKAFGAEAVLEKPFDEKELLDLVKRLAPDS